MRMTPILSVVPAALYQACCAATALRNWSIMPGLMSERRTTLSFPSHGIGAAAGACCATAGVRRSAGLRDRALKTVRARNRRERRMVMSPMRRQYHRSEEHTSELQSLRHLVCRLLLEKKK